MLKKFQRHTIRRVFALIVVLFLWHGAAAQAVVDVIANNGNDLVSKANAATSGTVINVPAGTYTITSAITLKSGVSLVGSSTGVTALNSTVGNCLFTITGADTVRIKNITINTDGSWRENGGIIHANGNTVKLVVENCKMSAYAGSYAGAMYVANGAYVRVSNSEFLNCRTNNANGGAIAVINATLDLISVSIHHCGLSSGSVNGGAVYALNSTLNVTGGKFYQNVSQSGGAFYFSGGVATLENAEIYENTLDGAGTGGAGYLTNNAEVWISNTTIMNNASTNSGAGFYLNGSNKLSLTGCTMVGNKNIGGNANTAGGIAADNSSEIDISNSIITGNTGGALGDDLPVGVDINVENSVVSNELIIDDTTKYTFTNPIVITPGDSGQVSITIPAEANDPETGESIVIPVPADEDGNPTIGSGEVIVLAPPSPPVLTLSVSDSMVCVGDFVTFTLNLEHIQGTVEYRFYAIIGQTKTQLEAKSNNVHKATFDLTTSSTAVIKYVGEVYDGGKLEVISNEVPLIVVPLTQSGTIDHIKNTVDN